MLKILGVVGRASAPVLLKSPICQNNILRSSKIKLDRSYIKSQLISHKNFHTSIPRSALPALPAVILLLSKVGKFGAALLVRWWTKLPQERKQIYIREFLAGKKYLTGIGGGLTFGGVAYYQTHTQEVPITKRKRFVAFSDEEYDEAWLKLLSDKLKEYEKLIISPKDGSQWEWQSYNSYTRVNNIVQNIINANKDIESIAEKSWTVTVINDDQEANAFVLPCGNIFIFTGMLKFCESDDELAFIIGHEMAHAILGHAVEESSAVHLLDMVLLVPLAALWTLLPSDTTAALFNWMMEKVKVVIFDLPYSAFIEMEADEVGIQLAGKACFDVREAPLYFAKIENMKENDLVQKYLSTHPTYEDRMFSVNEAVPSALKMREICQCPKLPVKDPRDKILMKETEYYMPKERRVMEGFMVLGEN